MVEEAANLIEQLDPLIKPIFVSWLNKAKQRAIAEEGIEVLKTHADYIIE
jgi:hypothetical protein